MEKWRLPIESIITALYPPNNNNLHSRTIRYYCNSIEANQAEEKLSIVEEARIHKRNQES